MKNLLRTWENEQDSKENQENEEDRSKQGLEVLHEDRLQNCERAGSYSQKSYEETKLNYSSRRLVKFI